MARLEDVLPGLREGKKIRRPSFKKGSFLVLKDGKVVDDVEVEMFSSVISLLLDDSWELVPEPTRVADYLVLQPTRWSQYQRDGIVFYKDTWFKETHPIGQQPEGSLMVPGTEREEGNDE